MLLQSNMLQADMLGCIHAYTIWRDIESDYAPVSNCIHDVPCFFHMDVFGSAGILIGITRYLSGSCAMCLFDLIHGF